MDQEIIDRKFKFLSWYEMEEACLAIYRKMKRDNYVPDSIIGLLRGGVVPARIFADYFGIVLDFFALDVKLYDGIGVRKEKPLIRYDFKDEDLKGRILVIDDIFDSGKTMKAVLDHFKGKDITTATLYWKEKAPGKPNYYARVAEKEEWIVFPFEVYEFKREIDKK
jgi:hypoxanthine phosphoribosyltransferase